MNRNMPLLRSLECSGYRVLQICRSYGAKGNVVAYYYVPTSEAVLFRSRRSLKPFLCPFPIATRHGLPPHAATQIICETGILNSFPSCLPHP
jgi:hypothetical protein